MPAWTKLADLTGLSKWYAGADASPPPKLQASEWLVWRTCQTFMTQSLDGLKSWINHFRSFLEFSADPLTDFIKAETIVHRCNSQLPDLIGELGEHAVRLDLGENFLNVMQKGANATGLPVLRFLSAWTALNSGHLELCIEECERVDQPFGPVYTIQGQALLELGRPKEAAEALRVAVKLAPREVLAWFQLAKACHVLGQCDEAFQALRECRLLAETSDEVALYMGLVALDSLDAKEHISEALQVLSTRVARYGDTPIVIFTTLRLAAAKGDRTAAQKTLAATTWPNLLAKPQALQLLAPLLRSLHTAGWMDIAAQVLSHAAPEGAAS